MTNIDEYFLNGARYFGTSEDISSNVLLEITTMRRERGAEDKNSYPKWEVKEAIERIENR